MASINESFSKSFAGIACAGEVELFEHDDYDQFAVHIKCAGERERIKEGLRGKPFERVRVGSALLELNTCDSYAVEAHTRAAGLGIMGVVDC